MTNLAISCNAIERYQEHVADLPERDVCECLCCPAVEAAAAIGAPFVRLAPGQRIVLVGRTIVTVLPRRACITAMFVRTPRSETRP